MAPRTSRELREAQQEEERELFARQVGRTVCAFCGWAYEGPFGKGQTRLVAHRDRKHRDEQRVRPPRSS